MAWGYVMASQLGGTQEGCCTGKAQLWGSGSLLSWVSEGHKMTTNDVSCHEAMVGMCLCHLRPPIWSNWNFVFSFRSPLKTLQTLSWLQGSGTTCSPPSPAALRLPGGLLLTHCPAEVLPGGTASPAFLPPAWWPPSPSVSASPTVCRTSFLT